MVANATPIADELEKSPKLSGNLSAMLAAIKEGGMQEKPFLRVSRIPARQPYRDDEYDCSCGCRPAD
jgi:hypothetical protein